MPTTAKKYFFKVYIPEKHYERVLIPKAFVKWTRLQERVPEDVILRNVSGRIWRVKTRRIGEKIYLDDGWKVFTEENSLGKADFLIFKYNGSKKFKVIVLELSTQIEKTLIKVEEDNTEENAAEDDEVEEEHQDKINKEDGKDVDYLEDDADEDEDEDEKEDDSDDNSDEDREMGKESEEEHGARYLRIQSCRRACKRDIGECSTPKVKTEVYCLEDNEFDPHIYIQPGNPYFEVKRYKNRPNELHIPKQAIKEFSLTFPQKVTLLCCQCFKLKNGLRNELRDYHLKFLQQTPINEKCFGVKGEVCKWQDGRVCITGWTRFCKMHNINKNNVCICEIISREDQSVRMFRVHVLGAKRG